MPHTEALSALPRATCPFCALLCDDIEYELQEGQVKLSEPVCRSAMRGFEASPLEASPMIEGRTVSHQEALAHAARLLKRSKHPFIGGLGVDVDGMRALMDLADRCGASVDHMNGDAIGRGNAMLATRGWIATTLAEVRNRADFILVLGADTLIDTPRFLQRCVRVPHGLHEDRLTARELVVLAPRTDAKTLRGLDAGIQHLPLQMDHVVEVLQCLRAAMAGKPPRARVIGGLKRDDLINLGKRLSAARYVVVTWGASVVSNELGEVALEFIGELLRDLNKTTRAAGLALLGGEGGPSANAVCAWQSGWPLRTDFATGVPVHDPLINNQHHQLGEHAADLLIWVSTFSTSRGAPETSQPSIVLGRAGLARAESASVFIPVATPGLDVGGRMVRLDGVVSMPLRKLRNAAMPSIRQVVGELLDSIATEGQS